MFDNPREKLQWLEEELLEEEDEYDEIYEDPDGEFDELMDRADDLLEEAPSAAARGFAFSRPRKNPAVDFSRTVYADEEEDDDSRYVEAPRRKGIKGLVFLACLEVLGILAIIGWWLRWLI